MLRGLYLIPIEAQIVRQCCAFTDLVKSTLDNGSIIFGSDCKSYFHMLDPFIESIYVEAFGIGTKYRDLAKIGNIEIKHLAVTMQGNFSNFNRNTSQR